MPLGAEMLSILIAHTRCTGLKAEKQWRNSFSCESDSWFNIVNVSMQTRAENGWKKCYCIFRAILRRISLLNQCKHYYYVCFYVFSEFSDSVIDETLFIRVYSIVIRFENYVICKIKFLNSYDLIIYRQQYELQQNAGIPRIHSVIILKKCNVI